MKTLVTVWFSPEGDIICGDCRADYAPARLRPSHVPAGRVPCAHCQHLIGTADALGGSVAGRGAPARPTVGGLA